MQSPDKLKLSYDQLLERLPPIGRWQVLVVLLTCVSGSFTGFFIVWPSFIRVKVPYECSEWINGGSENLTSVTVSPPPSPCPTDCTNWKFNYSGTDVSTSLQESFKLVCDKEDVLKYHGTIFFLGLFLGSPLGGFMSDRIGRIKWFRICVFTVILNSLMIGLTSCLILHLLLWFLISVQLMGAWITTFTLCSEIVPIKYRDIPEMIDCIIMGLVIACCSLLAYFITDWRNLTLTLSFISFVGFLLTFGLPESPRWLWSMGRFEEAIQILKFAISVQRENIDADFNTELESVIKTGERKVGFVRSLKRDLTSILGIRKRSGEGTIVKTKYSVIDIFKHRFLAFRIILLSYHWIIVNILFYGLLFGAKLFKQQLHVYSAIQGLASSAGCIGGIVVLRFLGRKTVMMICFSISGCCFAMSIFTPTDLKVITLTLAFLNKLCLTIVFIMCYIWTAEMNPTVLRSSAVGFASMTSRFAGLTIPYFDNFSEFWEHLPLLIYSMMAFSVVFCSLLLPETRGRKLPETIEEGEHFHRNDSLEMHGTSLASVET